MAALKPAKACQGPGPGQTLCGRPVTNQKRALCVGHYMQHVRKGALTPLQKRAGAPPRSCRGPGATEGTRCTLAVFARGLCAGHATQRRRGKRLRPLEALHAPRLSARDVAALLKQRRAGTTLVQLAAAFGVSKRTVSKYLARARGG